MVSNSGTHHRHLRPGWALAGGAGAKLPSFPLNTRFECAEKTASLPPDALARWQADRELFPPEQSLGEWTHSGRCLALYAIFRKRKCHGFSRRVQTFSLVHQRCYTRCARVRTVSTGLARSIASCGPPPQSGTMQETNVAGAAGASSEDDVMQRLVRAISARQLIEADSSGTSLLRARQPTGHWWPSGPTGGNAGQSSPAVGNTPTTSMLNCKYISSVCDGARERRSALACARSIFLTPCQGSVSIVTSLPCRQQV